MVTVAMKKEIAILGIRGIPARHGGFETFAEQLAIHLRKRGWQVTVYCQVSRGDTEGFEEWRGVSLFRIPVSGQGPFSTIVFDWKSTLHALKDKKLVLTLGYNTAIFCTMYRMKQIFNIMNMDGMEWKRKKWSMSQKVWLYLNEKIGCRVANHLIADNPEIKKHLLLGAKETKISMIPYGAELITAADANIPRKYGLEPNGYCLVIARVEPENNIAEIISAFSAKQRNCKLAVLGNLAPKTNEYHKLVKEGANRNVLFLGAIYDKTVVQALRYHCRLYLHGHSVGGTNPSLLESMGAGNAVLAHDNGFNRWVAGEGGVYFRDEDECARQLDMLLDNHEELRERSKSVSERFDQNFTWKRILGEYEELLNGVIQRGSCAEHVP